LQTRLDTLESHMLSLLTAAAIAICPASGPRHHCVVDGDTIWHQGEKIRIAEIDTPEMNGRCAAERTKARRARDRLVQLLNARPVRFTRTGRDRYGRTLANFGPVSEALIREGLATRWPRRGRWCHSPA
jgi:endonuclease YncB( thermonuclease family)